MILALERSTARGGAALEERSEPGKVREPPLRILAPRRAEVGALARHLRFLRDIGLDEGRFAEALYRPG